MTDSQIRAFGILALILVCFGGGGLIGSLLGYLLVDSGLMQGSGLLHKLGAAGAIFGVAVGIGIAGWLIWSTKNKPQRH